jgi:hypothetical protein
MHSATTCQGRNPTHHVNRSDSKRPWNAATLLVSRGLIDPCWLVTGHLSDSSPPSHASLFRLTTSSYNPHNSVLKMPGATFVSEGATSPDANVARTRLDKPLQYSGLLDSYTHSDLTTVIGTEYEGIQVVDLLSAKNSDALIRDLAVTISQRGVVFLRDQDVTPQQMRELMEKITVLAGSVRCPLPRATCMLLTFLSTARIIRSTRSPAHRGRK